MTSAEIINKVIEMRGAFIDQYSTVPNAVMMPSSLLKTIRAMPKPMLDSSLTHPDNREYLQLKTGFQDERICGMIVMETREHFGVGIYKPTEHAHTSFKHPQDVEEMKKEIQKEARHENEDWEDVTKEPEKMKVITNMNDFINKIKTLREKYNRPKEYWAIGFEMDMHEGADPKPKWSIYHCDNAIGYVYGETSIEVLIKLESKYQELARLSTIEPREETPEVEQEV